MFGRLLGMASVLITGASRGIGRLTAVELARRGHRVIATAQDPRTLDDLDVDQRLRLDVTDQATVDAAVAEAGEIDVLISNAGNMVVGSMEATPIEVVEHMLDLNVIGGIRVTQAVLPQMRERGSGRLIFISSVLGRISLAGFAPYSASKWAVEALGEALAFELQPFGIDVAVAEPGPTNSGLLDRLENYTLPDDPYGLTSPITPDITGPTEQVAAALADLVEAPSVPLRAPIGAFAEYVVKARGDAPWDRPFALG
jgi:NAD(P)-dependent dehydrogenase (short-subunit alcohol dehydrogenase family)